MPDSPFSPFAHTAADRIDSVGEVALIRMIRTHLGDATLPSPQGIGDDCAVWQSPPQGEQLLFTTDAIVYGRHFDATCPPELAAAKLLKRNLSDIAAMGGTPHSALLALTLAPNTRLSWLQGFIDGLRECALHYVTPVTGGDITAGTDNFFAAHITLIGHAKRPVLRSGAQVGDHLFVTGALGGSILGHHLHFSPRLSEGRWLAAQPDVRAMIDITDGLAKDLPELLGNGNAETEAASPRVIVRQAHAQAEGQRSPLVGGQAQYVTDSINESVQAEGVATIALLKLDALPLTTAARTASAATLLAQSPAAISDTAITHALCDGEDYELLFAVAATTDPTEFVARWQAHFGQKQPPVAGSPSQPQAAYPYLIGRIATAPNHPQGTSRLYNAANSQPLALAKGGFEHL